MSRFGKMLALTILLSWAGPAPAEVIYPQDGHSVSGDAAWLVVSSPEKPVVTLDGRVLEVTATENGVHHIRLDGLGEAAARVEVRWGRDAARTLSVSGRSAAPRKFHPGSPAECWTCHDGSPTGCGECHPRDQAGHAPLAQGGCCVCHQPPAWQVPDLESACSSCHEGYGRGKHPKLRHSIQAPRDPRRPGRNLDCASCHDPHAPRCMSCLTRAELRQWCKDCHR